MTMQECYEAIGGNYEDVLGRLRSEALIQRFTLKFLEDPSSQIPAAILPFQSRSDGTNHLFY